VNALVRFNVRQFVSEKCIDFQKAFGHNGSIKGGDDSSASVQSFFHSVGEEKLID